jgi:hypothetical protein
MSLEQDTITFGKYKGSTLTRVLRDRAYCKWLLEQDWFENQYEWLYNRVKEYNPNSSFLNIIKEEDDFLTTYRFFNLKPISELEIELSVVDKTCYEYYLQIIQEIKEKMYERLENQDNPYDIKAPTNWLKRFEKEYGIPRADFKDFITAYELPNIPYVIERIKKEGGIEYKGAKSFTIAKARSQVQEEWWEQLLKRRYGEDIGTQFKYEHCIFDFLNIATKTIFECKLGLKDFDKAQHIKYSLALKEYRIIYLIATDCVIEMEKSCIYTTNPDKYEEYILSIPSIREPNWLCSLLQYFDVVEVEDLSLLFGNDK